MYQSCKQSPEAVRAETVQSEAQGPKSVPEVRAEDVTLVRAEVGQTVKPEYRQDKAQGRKVEYETVGRQ